MTSKEGIYNILKTNKLFTSPIEGITGHPQNKRYSRGKFYFFSVARSMLTDFFKIIKFGPIMKLDGNKLSQNFKAAAADLDAYERVPSNNPKTTTNMMEDRIVTNKPYIDNASKYIIEIYYPLIGISKTKWEEMEFKEEMYEIRDMAKQRSVPIYFFERKEQKKEDSDDYAITKTYKPPTQKDFISLEDYFIKYKDIDGSFDPIQKMRHNFFTPRQFSKEREEEIKETCDLVLNILNIKTYEVWKKYEQEHGYDFGLRNLEENLYDALGNSSVPETRKKVSIIKHFMKKNKMEDFLDLRNYLVEKIRHLKNLKEK
jgi:hypothetical protein